MDDYINLSEFGFNIYSQNGEDGIIQELIKRLNLNKSNKKNWCVEFGAWDGIHLSNTFYLVTEGWEAVYIEGDPHRFNSLKKTRENFKNIFPINNYVSKDKKSKTSLDNLLKITPIPKEFELLSIDIDSFDLEVWESLSLYKPKIVIIEINSSYLPGIYKWHSDYNKNCNGNSFSATLNVAQKKGYELVCHTGNMIFVKRELLELININDKYILYPELLFNYKWFSIAQKGYIFNLILKIKAFFKEKIIRRLKEVLKK